MLLEATCCLKQHVAGNMLPWCKRGFKEIGMADSIVAIRKWRKTEEHTVGFCRQKPDVVRKSFSDVVGQLQLDIRVAMKFQHGRGLERHRQLNG